MTEARLIIDLKLKIYKFLKIYFFEILKNFECLKNLKTSENLKISEDVKISENLNISKSVLRFATQRNRAGPKSPNPLPNHSTLLKTMPQAAGKNFTVVSNPLTSQHNLE